MAIDKIKNISKTSKILLAFATVVLILIAFVIWPTLKSIEKNSKDLISAKNSVATLAAQNKETQNFKKDYESYKPNLTKIDQLFVDQADPVNFIEFLEDAANNHQVSLQISLPSGPQDSTQQYAIFQIACKGSFSNILDFMKDIETGAYLIDVESASIRNSANFSTDKKTGEPVVSYPANYSLREIDAAFSIKAFIE
ncbi:MAG: hypothetical protein NT155_01205 [Candidatus Staskawiczbacteria bacterium]|nr:hypothetical protein [Candidatus Staskawiczbacteria bacterium]